MVRVYEPPKTPCYTVTNITWIEPMVHLNKTSVREEVEKLKSDYEAMRKKSKLSPEVLLFIKSMFMIIELILSVFLEKQTKKDHKNSSKPSSQTGKDNSSLSQEGSHGKGKQTNANVAQNTRTIETITLIEVTECDCCGEDLSRILTTAHERRTKIDIVFEKVVEHVDVEIKTCPTCTSIVKAPFPPDMKSPLHYGVGLKAYIINLVICQMLALKRIQTLIQSLFSIVISEATMLKFVLRLYFALENWEKESVDYLLKQPAMHVDETSLRVDKQNQWIHVYSAGDVTLKHLHRKRGQEAMEEINIIPRYGGNIIHDCWGSYLAYEHCGHGLCGSHLLRELTFIIESNGYAWAKNMKRLLQQTCKKISQRKRKKLSEKEYLNLQKNFRNILTRGEAELPLVPQKANGKRGKIAKSDAHNLWERLKTYEESVLLFAKNPHVSFTNNRAEQDLRMAKVKQKVSGCFRKEIYAKAYCRISSYLQTMANRGIDPLVAIQMVLTNNISVPE